MRSPGCSRCVLALPAIGQWQSWLLFRNAREFGIADEQFGVDVGFYVFQLPFLSFVLNWLFAALIVVLLLTIATHVLNGGVVFVSPMPVVRQATKAHIAVLLAVLAIIKAADYWLDRYEVTNSQRGIVQGATYSVVKAQLPAILLLILIALLTAGLYLSVVKTGSFRLPLIASALWLVVAIVGGVIYPAVVQSLVVNPNQEVTRAAVHRAQRGRHAPGDRSHRRRGALGRVRHADHRRGRGRSRTAGERPPAQPDRDGDTLRRRPWRGGRA